MMLGWEMFARHIQDVRKTARHASPVRFIRNKWPYKLTYAVTNLAEVLDLIKR